MLLTTPISELVEYFTLYVPSRFVALSSVKTVKIKLPLGLSVSNTFLKKYPIN